MERTAEAKPAEGQVRGVVRIGVLCWGWHTGARGGLVWGEGAGMDTGWHQAMGFFWELWSPQKLPECFNKMTSNMIYF